MSFQLFLLLEKALKSNWPISSCITNHFSAFNFWDFTLNTTVTWVCSSGAVLNKNQPFSQIFRLDSTCKLSLFLEWGDLDVLWTCFQTWPGLSWSSDLKILLLLEKGTPHLVSWGEWFYNEKELYLFGAYRFQMWALPKSSTCSINKFCHIT